MSADPDHQAASSAGSLNARQTRSGGEVSAYVRRIPASNGSTATYVRQLGELGHPALRVAPAGVLVGEPGLPEVQPRAAAGQRLQPELDQRRPVVDGLAHVAPAPREARHRLEDLDPDGDPAVALELEPAVATLPQVEVGALPEPGAELPVVGQGAPQALRRRPEVQLPLDGGHDRRGHVTPPRGGGAGPRVVRPRPRRTAAASRRRLLQRRRLELVQAFAPIAAHPHEAGPPQDVEVLGHRLARHRQPLAQVLDRGRPAVAEALEQQAAGGIGDGDEDGIHGVAR